MDIIFLREIRLDARIGIYKREKAITQTVELDLELALPDDRVFSSGKVTDTIDYAVVITGEIHMELDNGVVCVLKAGDVLVQRGTIHNWVNRGPEVCIIAFVLICAKPVKIEGESLTAVN